MRRRLPDGEHPEPGLLHALADGEASPEESLALARHLRDCGRCSAVRARIARLSGRLDSLPAAEEPFDFTARVMQRVRAMPAPRRRVPLLRLVAPALVLLSGLAVAAANLIPGRAVGGFGHLLQPELRPDLLEMLVSAIAAAIAGLGRAVAGVLPQAPSVPGLHPLSTPLPLLFLVVLSALVLAATSMVMVAFAGRGLLRHCTRKG